MATDTRYEMPKSFCIRRRSKKKQKQKEGGPGSCADRFALGFAGKESSCRRGNRYGTRSGPTVARRKEVVDEGERGEGEGAKEKKKKNKEEGLGCLDALAGLFRLLKLVLLLLLDVVVTATRLLAHLLHANEDQGASDGDDRDG